MKFHLVRPALVLASSLVLASCGGGGGEETYPVKVTVFGVVYPDLILSTNGQELPVPVPAKAGDSVVLNFPQNLSYGTYYNVVPKGGSAAGGGSQPKHQTCVTASYPNGNYPREYGTAGQTASTESARKPAIEVFYTCSVNAYPLGGSVSGLEGTTASITLINGSNSQITLASTATTTTPMSFSLAPVQFGTSYGVTVLTQPAGYTCTVANGTGVMLEAQEANKGVNDVAVTCVKNA